MSDEKEPSTPYGQPDHGDAPKSKDPATGEPSAPYGETEKGTSGGLPSDVEPDPSSQPG